MINIGKDIKISIESFKGKKYIHIRKWYEKDGELRPGKGISMDIDTWKEFESNFEDIKKYIRESF
jgi:hypothetical protein